MERAINRFLLKLIVHQSPVLLCGIVELDLLVVCGVSLHEYKSIILHAFVLVSINLHSMEIR